MALAVVSRRLLRKPPLTYSPYRNTGYVILLPEVGEELQGKNPLLQPNGLPEFTNIAVENCIMTVGRQALEFQVSLRELEGNITKAHALDVFADVLDPLEILSAPLDITWGISKAIYLGNGTRMPTSSYMGIHERAKRARAIKFYSRPIYDAIKNQMEAPRWSEQQRRVLRKFALEGKLNGLELSSPLRGQLFDVLAKLQNARDSFKSRVEQATRAFHHQITDAAVMADFPVDVKQMMAVDANNYLVGPWRVTLQPQVYKTFMERCPDREMRWNAWQAMVGRGSTMGASQLATSTLLEQIRELRQQQARRLGYANYAELSMETKMAGSATKVKEVLDHLLAHAKPAQRRELDTMHEFAVARGFRGARIELWDVPYWRRQQQLERTDVTADSVRDYFPLPVVLRGLFRIIAHHFGLEIRERTGISTWHKYVKYYDVLENNEPIAGFYLDPHPATVNDKLRVNHNHGWMIAMRNRSAINAQQPLACLVFNFEVPPNEQQPTLLTYDDVRFLFAKFGHALQHLGTRATYAEVAGLSGVEWDMVEMCGHVFADLLNRKSTVEMVSSHWQTGAPLPVEQLNCLVARNRHTAGIELSRELYLAALDLALHASSDRFWLDVVKELWPRYRDFPLHKHDSHPCSFTAIMSEEWGAAYYAHVWSRMVAADVSRAFEEADGDEEVSVVGRRFRETFLAMGGSCGPARVFREFRGRDPCPNALLRTLGLV